MLLNQRVVREPFSDRRVGDGVAVSRRLAGFRYAPSVLLNQRVVREPSSDRRVGDVVAVSRRVAGFRYAPSALLNHLVVGVLVNHLAGAGCSTTGALEHGVGDQAQRVEAYLRVEGVGHADELVGAGVTLDL